MSHCIKCLSEHAEHPLLLQILFVECVLVGSEGMTEQNLIRIDSRRSDATHLPVCQRVKLNLVWLIKKGVFVFSHLI